jgi:hypothetical protein
MYYKYNNERKPALVVISGTIHDTHISVLKVLGLALYGICCGRRSSYSCAFAGSPCNRRNG